MLRWLDALRAALVAFRRHLTIEAFQYALDPGNPAYVYPSLLDTRSLIVIADSHGLEIEGVERMIALKWQSVARNKGQEPMWRLTVDRDEVSARWIAGVATCENDDSIRDAFSLFDVEDRAPGARRNAGEKITRYDRNPL